MSIADLNNRLSNMFPALTHRNFKLFWTGQCISLIGTWMQNIGQSWLVLQLTKSAYKLGIVSSIQFLPMMIFSLFAGTFIDKLPKKKLIIFTQFSFMILAFTLATLTYLKVIKYWHILILSLLLGFANTLDMPARQSFMIELVGKDDLMNAIALNSSIFNLARLLGPSVAGILIGWLGIPVCFYLNAISFVAVIIGLVMIKVEPKERQHEKQHVFRDIKEGLNYIAGKPVIYIPILMLAVISAFVMNFSVVIPVFAQNTLKQNATGYGFLMAAMGAGALIGALNLATSSKNGPKMLFMLGGALGMSVFEIIVGLQKFFVLSFIILLIIGFCSISFTATVNTTIQLNSEDYIRGRVMSVYSLVFGGVVPIGSLYAGRITETMGASGCFIVSGIIGVATVILLGSVYFKKRHMIDENS